jgi:hypothetical protein
MANANGTASTPPVETVDNSKASDSNPFLKHIERAPYELGYLLLDLPRYTSQIPAKDKNGVLKATAAATHATNARHTLVDGLEALGSLMFVAGVNDESELDNGALSALGCLIKHIAQEIQLLNGIGEEFGQARKGGAQ